VVLLSSGLFSFSLVSDAKMAIGGATTPLGALDPLSSP
jgi:hypothetical protein